MLVCSSENGLDVVSQLLSTSPYEDASLDMYKLMPQWTVSVSLLFVWTRL